MKRVLIISYELKAPALNKERLLQKIKAYGTWARLSGSAYLIVTAATPVAVRDSLGTTLGGGDRLFVGESPAPSAWKGISVEVSQWILRNQE